MENGKRRNVKNLYKCFNQIVLTAQLFGLLPVAGIQYYRAKKIVFKWCSLNAIYCHLVIFTTFIVVLMSLYDMMICTALLQKISKHTHYHHLQFNHCCVVATAAFYVSSLLISVIFLELARKWKKIMLLWEASDGMLCFYNCNTDLTKKTNTIMLVILINACGNEKENTLYRFDKLLFLL